MKDAAANDDDDEEEEEPGSVIINEMKKTLIDAALFIAVLFLWQTVCWLLFLWSPDLHTYTRTKTQTDICCFSMLMQLFKCIVHIIS